MDIVMIIFASIVSGAVFAASTSGWQSVALILVLCITGQKNKIILLSIISFYLAACLPIINVVGDYSDNYYSALFSYAILVIINTTILAIAALQNSIAKWAAIPLAFVVLSVPPLSGINPVSIAPVAGWLFPSTGTFGLLALIVLISGLTARDKIRMPFAASALIIGISSSTVYANTGYGIDNLQAFDIVRGTENDLTHAALRTAYRYEELSMVQSSSADIVLLPESVFGVWNPADGLIHSHSRANVYGGARKYINDSEYVNVVVNAKTGVVIYEQLNPPFVLLRKGAKATKGVGALDDYGFSILICYEVTNTWIAIQSFNRTDPVVWISNLSWSRSSYLERRMASTLEAWSRLYKRKSHKAVLQHA